MSSSSQSSGGKCRQISLDEIKEATNNFAESNVVGDGGEGKVYLAQIKLGWKLTQVAVKHLKPNSQEEFDKEIKTISKIQHPNLVSLLGYCNESGQKILLYEFMEKGSLADYVTKKSKIYLSWLQRIRICLDAARGLQHLHIATGENPKGIIHRDVKPGNILLGKDWVAKISDFGMVKLSDADQVKSTMVTGLKGTGGYYAPEYVKYQSVTRRIDVYAFGVVLFQVLCLKMPWDRGDESYYGMEEEDLGIWAHQNVDPIIKPNVSDDSLKEFTAIVGKSLKYDPRKRPTMDGVVLGLEKVLKLLEREYEAKKGQAVKESTEHSTAGSHLGSSSVTSETIAEHEYNQTIVLDIGGGITKAPQDSVVGPWGGQGGQPWTYVPNGPITHIFITYGDIINTIRFTSQNESGNAQLSDQFGEKVGNMNAEIDIDAKVEKLSGISGTIGEHGGLVVTSLSFTTNKNKSYGPFGTAEGTAFSYKVNDVENISGFHGRSGWYLDAIIAIGVYVRPKRNLSVGPWGSQEPGNQWTYEPKGVISCIFITHDDAIYSIRFTSQDDKGNVEYSETFGWTRGSKSDEIVIDIKNEKLNCISGTVGVKSGYVSITSLTFSTDKKKTFGPFGTPGGTAFSLLAKDQGFVGFHGRSGSWLDAIGVYLKPLAEQCFGQWGCQEPGNEWSYVPKGAISHISFTHDDAINTIRFTSQDDEGNLDHSKTFGWTTGTKSSEIGIDIKKEKLNNISGTTGLKSGYLVVTSLSFSTDKNTVFGPFGTARGTAFSARPNNGTLSGFFGRSGYWLDAIGVVVKPTE